MRTCFLNLLGAVLLFCGNTVFAQGPSWIVDAKKAIVKIESVQQRYNFIQADVLLRKEIDTIKGLSQHDTYAREDALLNIKDTIRGTGLMVADGAKIYLVTAKHLIKATEKLGNGLETINDRLSIKTAATDKKTNDISLMNLATTAVNQRPFLFSDDQSDLAIISFQKNDYKAIVAYMKQNGCVPVPVGAIAAMGPINAGDEVFTVGFPAIGGSGKSVVSNGKVSAVNKSHANFTADMTVYPGNTGGPVFKNNQLVGVLSYQSGILTNIDAAMHPFDKANSATVTKASSILLLLRKLQANERNPAFNK